MAWQPPSEEEFNDEWITPLDALEVSDIRMADEHEQWAIVEKLRAGQIIAVARTGQTRGDLVGVQPFVPVSAGAWNRMGDNEEHYFWKTGHLLVERPTSTGYGSTTGMERYFDIRFDPASFSGRPPQIHPHDPAPQPTPPDPVELVPASSQRVERNKGGRPSYEYWEPLLIEMARQLHNGDLQPKRQADIEKAMHDWIIAKGHKGGETQVRQRAKSLWEAIEKEVGK